MTNKLDLWAAEKGLTLSPKITVRMIFKKRRKRNEEPIEIMLRSKIIPYKESTQSLRMTLHSRLNWEGHINKLRTEVKRKLNTIRFVAS